jgi:hypothetical protein
MIVKRVKRDGPSKVDGRNSWMSNILMAMGQPRQVVPKNRWYKEMIGTKFGLALK